MKHEQSKKKNKGDGQRTCLVCGIDFTSHQRGRKPVSVNFCDHCESVQKLQFRLLYCKCMFWEVVIVSERERERERESVCSVS